jgi:hypothetical protein
LGERFDAVVVHDAVEYMLTEDDLAATFATVRAHLEPGGLALILPDCTAEVFESGAGVSGGSDLDDGRAARLFEWTWDPDVTDTWVQTEYVFVLREADGTVRSFHESHRTGLFPEATWLRLLRAAGFEVRAETEETTEDREPRTIFLAAAPEG